MNLWVRTLRQLTVLAVALIFFSCEDETSILGFKNPNKKFKVNFIDIPLESSVLLMDSLRTTNFTSQTETNRLLVGRYADEHMGSISSTAVTQFFTTNSAKTLLKETAVFDSVSIQLRFDFYTYGSQSVSPQTVTVHEVGKVLKLDSIGYYFNKSNASYNPSALGTKTFTISPADFKKYIDDRKDTAVTVNIRLDPSFGQRIFDSAVKYRNSNTVADSAFVKFSEFSKEFKGLAIVPNTNDKIVGFNPASSDSRLVVHYHDAENDSLELNLGLSGVISYNQITADRSSTALAELTQYSQPVTPESLRYIQSGSGVLTRLDFNNFYEFVDADTNATMVVNSAELQLGAPVGTSTLAPIEALSLRALKGDGYLRKIASQADSVSVSLYGGQLTVDRGLFTPVGHDGSIFTLRKAGDHAYYNGYLTLFAQQLFKKEPDKERFRYFAIFPESPQIGKGVNRMVIQAQDIKIRVYYTRPTEITP